MQPPAASPPSLRVVVADDAALLRRHVVGLLAEVPGVHVVAEAATLPETLAQVRFWQPDVLLLDLHMPGGTGLEGLPHLHRLSPATRVIVLTGSSDVLYRRACLQGGAAYCFDKACEFERMLEVLHRLAAAPRRAPHAV